MRLSLSGKSICDRPVVAQAVLFLVLAVLLPTALWAEGAGHLSAEDSMRRLVERGANPDFVLLDVRTPGEYAKGHIQGAKLLDFYHRDFLKRLKTLDRNRDYLLYCRTGNRSGRTLTAMQQLGFKRAAHLAGGVVAWQAKGYSLVKAKVVDPDLLAP